MEAGGASCLSDVELQHRFMAALSMRLGVIGSAVSKPGGVRPSASYKSQYRERRSNYNKRKVSAQEQKSISQAQRPRRVVMGCVYRRSKDKHDAAIAGVHYF